MACAAKSRLRNCAGARASRRVCTTAGRKSSSKPASGGWRATRRGRRPRTTLHWPHARDRPWQPSQHNKLARVVRRYGQSRLQNQFFLKLAVRRRIGDARADITHRRWLKVELLHRRNVGQVEISERAEVTRHARINATSNVGRFLDGRRLQYADDKARDTCPSSNALRQFPV